MEGPPQGVPPREDGERNSAGNLRLPPRGSGLLGRLTLMEWLLKYRDRIYDDISASRGLRRYVVDSLLVTLVGTVFYGFVVGICIGGWQILYDPIKMPWILVFTLLLCLPSLYVFSCYLGSRLGLLQTCAIAFNATAIVSTILMGFAPVTWFFMFTAPESHHFAVLINVVVFAVAGFFGVQFLLRGIRAVYADVPTPPAVEKMVRWWVVLYAAVGVQMAWLLRPYFTATDVFIRPRTGNFFVAVMTTLWQFLSGEGW